MLRTKLCELNLFIQEKNYWILLYKIELIYSNNSFKKHVKMKKKYLGWWWFSEKWLKDTAAVFVKQW